MSAGSRKVKRLDCDVAIPFTAAELEELARIAKKERARETVRHRTMKEREAQGLPRQVEVLGEW